MMDREKIETVASVALILFAIAGAGLLLNLALADIATDAKRLETPSCERVLRCLDIGVERAHCDALFPGCEAPTEENR